MHLRNAPTRLMKDLNYGKGYQYAHDFQDKLTTMTWLPEALQNKEYYHPTEQGHEKKSLCDFNKSNNGNVRIVIKK